MLAAWYIEFHAKILARGLDETTVPLGLIRAHIAIDPLTSLSSTFEGVIAPFTIFLFVTARRCEAARCRHCSRADS